MLGSRGMLWFFMLSWNVLEFPLVLSWTGLLTRMFLGAGGPASLAERCCGGEVLRAGCDGRCGELTVHWRSSGTGIVWRQRKQPYCRRSQPFLVACGVEVWSSCRCSRGPPGTGKAQRCVGRSCLCENLSLLCCPVQPLGMECFGGASLSLFGFDWVKEVLSLF